MPLENGLLIIIVYVTLSFPAAFLATIFSLFLIERFFSRFFGPLPGYFPTASNILRIIVNFLLENFFLKSSLFRSFLSWFFTILAIMSSFFSIFFISTVFNPVFFSDIAFNFLLSIAFVVYPIVGYRIRQAVDPGKYFRARSLQSVIPIFFLNVLIYLFILGGSLLAGNSASHFFSFYKYATLAFSVPPLFSLGFYFHNLRVFLRQKKTLHLERLLENAFYNANTVNERYAQNPLEKRLLQEILASGSKESLLSGYVTNSISLLTYNILSLLRLFQRGREYYKLRGRYYFQTSNFRKLRRTIEKGNAYLKRSGQPESQTLISLRVATLIKNGLYDNALMTLDHAISKWETNPYFWLYRSQAFWHKDDLRDAKECNDRVLEIDPRSPLALSDKVQFLCEEILYQHRPNLDRIKESVSSLTEYLKTAFLEAQKRFSYRYYPPALVNSAGLLQLLNQNYRKAIELFEYGAKVHSHSDSLLYLGLIYLMGNLSFYRSEYLFDEILHLLKNNPHNRVYRIAAKNLKGRVIEGRRRGICFNERIVCYPFIEDDNIPEGAVVKTGEEMEEMEKFKKRMFYKMRLGIFYRYLSKQEKTSLLALSNIGLKIH